MSNPEPVNTWTLRKFGDQRINHLVSARKFKATVIITIEIEEALIKASDHFWSPK